MEMSPPRLHGGGVYQLGRPDFLDDVRNFHQGQALRCVDDKPILSPHAVVCKTECCCLGNISNINDALRVVRHLT